MNPVTTGVTLYPKCVGTNPLTWISCTTEIAQNQFIFIRCNFCFCFSLAFSPFFILLSNLFLLFSLLFDIPLSLPLFSILLSCLFLFLSLLFYLPLSLSFFNIIFLLFFLLHLLIKFLYMIIIGDDSCLGYQLSPSCHRFCWNRCKD